MLHLIAALLDVVVVLGSCVLCAPRPRPRRCSRSRERERRQYAVSRIEELHRATVAAMARAAADDVIDSSARDTTER